MKALNYELRCRKCGMQIEIAGIRNIEAYGGAVISWKHEKSTYPTLQFCNNCKQETVQDIIAFKEVES